MNYSGFVIIIFATIAVSLSEIWFSSSERETLPRDRLGCSAKPAAVISLECEGCNLIR
jgi:hypothetical protein